MVRKFLLIALKIWFSVTSQAYWRLTRYGPFDNTYMSSKVLWAISRPLHDVSLNKGNFANFDKNALCGLLELCEIKIG